MGDDNTVDLIVVGGGVMGLFTAYHASGTGARVAIVERGRVGDPSTASFGRTRSYRRDYLDETYVRLADEAMRLWTEFEQACGTRALVRCGCMNIASAAVTPDLAGSYGRRSAEVMRAMGVAPRELDAAAISERFGFLRADEAQLDDAAGLVDLASVTETLLKVLGERGVRMYENTTVTHIVDDGSQVRVSTDGTDLVGRALVITAGHGTNDVLDRLEGCDLQIPLVRDRPSEAKYFRPRDPAPFAADRLPVIAYLDTGIYVHPSVDGVIDAVKVGYYNPPDLPRGRTGINSIAEFVTECMPGLQDAEVSDVLDVDQCDYDLVPDDDFVLGPVPGRANVFVGVGWRGTGYKFAPWVGQALSRLAWQRGPVPETGRFDPGRFAVPARSGAVA